MEKNKHEELETLELLLHMLNEENEFVSEKGEEVHYLSLNDLEDNGKNYIYINTFDEKVVYFNNSEDIIDKIKDLNLDFKEQKKG
ncbi:hypothetical protein GOQ27_11785 [Clostridium sp. D2Q-11]|uniref:Uncharacterized protein n=1 Tax=Anaeromonas frigoriresistens TaxID=2683708 RepID=A0A942V389_9FIRM|nr:hypothetical protein [Anaeromonas frigoriresistens]MBS4539147.1 hypothetical protein [Anaeromonas frigoriresistens]